MKILEKVEEIRNRKIDDKIRVEIGGVSDSLRIATNVVMRAENKNQVTEALLSLMSTRFGDPITVDQTIIEDRGVKSAASGLIKAFARSASLFDED